MKKIFTLFAAALVSLCAFADHPDGPCPSKFTFKTVTEEANRVEIELQLINSSLNLNGFNMQVRKPEAAQWVMIDEIFEQYATNEGYGHNILGAWAGHTAAQMEAGMSKMMDWNTSVKDEGGEQVLVIIEILKTNACRFFPQFTEEAPGSVAKFAIDFSGCPDGVYEVRSENTPNGSSFSYTGGVEGSCSWSPDEPAVMQVEKTGDVVKEYTAISTIAVDQPTDNRIFDLQGRELQSVPEHGIYIQNGKKYVK